MAKLPRKTQKIFCSKPTSENQTSVFGTMKTADKQYSTDVGTLQSNAAYEQGWKSATIASYKPFMEDFNTLNYINTSQLAYLFQQGIPEWDEATAYYKNSFCSYNGDLWQSLIDDNLGNAPFEGDEWTLFTTKNKGGGLELCDIGTALYVDETKGLRRILNGGILDITFNYKAFLTRLLKIKDTNPDYFTTEANWQAEKAMNIDGCVYKFVLNYDSTGTNVVSVRLPKYPDYVEVSADGTATQIPVKTNQTAFGDNAGALAVPAKNTDVTYYVKSQDGSGNVFVNNETGSSVRWYADLTGVKLNSRTKLKMRYFIQVATGQETENNIINEIELNNPYSLFDSKYSDHKLDNLSWLKSEGQWNAKAVYPTAYDELLKEYNNPDRLATFNKDAFEVVGSPTITDDGVASGFSPSNYCATPKLIINKDFIIETPVFSPVDFNSIHYVLSGRKSLTDDTRIGFRVGTASLGRIYFDLPDERSFQSGTNLLKLNKKYQIKIETSNNKLKIYYREITQEYIYLTEFDYTTIDLDFLFKIGWHDTSPYYFTGSIDLKQFSITVDGQRVFSGANSMVKLWTDESATDYDFRINTADETFRLPLLDGSEDLPSGEYLDWKSYVTATETNLPAAPYNGYLAFAGNTTATIGYIYSGTTKLGQGSGQTTAQKFRRDTIFLKKGDSSHIFISDVNGVESLKFIKAQGNGSLYFYVGETVQNANLIDAGRIGEELSNKVDINSKVIDGQWIFSNKELSASTTAGTYTIDMSKYIPNDSYQYEVLLKIQQASTNANATITTLASDVFSTRIAIAITSTVTVDCVNCFSWVVGSKRVLTKTIEGPNCNGNRLLLIAYRRLGTNI